MKFYLKTLLFLIGLLLSSSGLLAQDFVSNQSLDSLPISKIPMMQIVDVDNDGRLDVFLRGRDVNGHLQSYVAYRVPDMDTIVNDSFQLQLINIDTTHRGIFDFSDLNNDNTMDLVISGRDTSGDSKTAIYHGQADFNFEAGEVVADFEADKMELSDLDNDGEKEIILSGVDSLGEQTLQIFTKEMGMYMPVDSAGLPGLLGGEMIVFDFDNNGFNDLFYSGRDTAGMDQTLYYFNVGEFAFMERDSLVPEVFWQQATVGDFDHDGNGDLFVSGFNEAGDTIAGVYLNRDTIFEDAPLGLDSVLTQDMLFADLNGDGAVDFVTNGKDSLGATVNYAYLGNGIGTVNLVDTLLPIGQNMSQAFGDFFRDGNLDAVQLKQNGANWQLEFFRNSNLPVNNRPSAVGELFTINTYDDVKIVWTDALDQSTPNPSITFDLFIGTPTAPVELVAPEFDYDSQKRLLVGHGNQGFRRMTSRKELLSNIYPFGIQSVDNSFHAGPDNDGSSVGSGGGVAQDSFVVCDELLETTIAACSGSSITLPVPNGQAAGWYSERKDYLGISSNLFYSVDGTDSVFYAVVNSLECSEHGVFIIEPVEPDSVDILSDTLLCYNDVLQLAYTGSYDSLEWIVSSTMDTLTNPSFDYIALENDSISIKVHDGVCTYNDQMTIEVSDIEVLVAGDFFEIELGQSVELEASGADFYKWTPPAGLSDVNIPNPLATPTQTTTYMVTGWDAAMCLDSASVLVQVDVMSYAPTLFTPNKDGRNDAFKLYGASYDVANFSFKIFNKGGQKVFESDSYGAMQDVGWDGVYGGKDQPAGIYYWKVTGVTDLGEQFLINDAEKGMLHLMR